MGWLVRHLTQGHPPGAISDEWDYEKHKTG
jgi:hypothetical protein